MKLMFKFGLYSVATFLCVSALWLLAASSAQAQSDEAKRQSIEQAESHRQTQSQLSDQRMRENDSLSAVRLKIESDLQRAARQRPMALEQIRGDFARIQHVRNDLLEASSATATLELGLISKSASEIRRLAERLKRNLALPEPEQEAGPKQTLVATDPQQLRSSVEALGQAVHKWKSGAQIIERHPQRPREASPDKDLITVTVRS